MKFLPLLLILLFPLYLPAQTDCPGVSVIGPSRITVPGELMTFTATVKPAPDGIKYRWTTSAGKIVEGAGTPSVKIDPFKYDRLTVTVDIEGLPPGCPTIASDTGSWTLAPSPVLLVDFRGPVHKFEMAQIEEIRKAIRADYFARLFVFVGYKTKAASAKREKETFILKNFDGNEKNRIVFAKIGGKIDIVQIWLQPAGASEPEFKP